MLRSVRLSVCPIFLDQREAKPFYVPRAWSREAPPPANSCSLAGDMSASPFQMHSKEGSTIDYTRIQMLSAGRGGHIGSSRDNSAVIGLFSLPLSSSPVDTCFCNIGLCLKVNDLEDLDQVFCDNRLFFCCSYFLFYPYGMSE